MNFIPGMTGLRAFLNSAAAVTFPTWRDAGTRATNTTSPLAPGYPVGVQVGDYCILHVFLYLNGATVPAPAGWTLIGRMYNYSAAVMWLFGKYIDGSETTVSVPFTGGTATAASAQIFAWKGVHPTSPMDDMNTPSSDASYQSGFTTLPLYQVTPTGPNRLVVHHFTAINDKAAIATAGWTERANWTVTNYLAGQVQEIPQPLAGLSVSGNLTFAVATLYPVRAAYALNPLGAIIPTVEWTGQSVLAGAGSSVTFSGISIGAAATGRRVFISIYSNAGAQAALSGVTINGLACTQLQHIQRDGATWTSLYVSPEVASGTTANIVVTYANAPNAVALATFRALNMASWTATYALASGSTQHSFTAASTNIKPAGAVMLHTGGMSAEAFAFTYSGPIPKQFDAGGAASCYHCGGALSTPYNKLSADQIVSATDKSSMFSTMWIVR
jgi:hypothetical protein